MFTYITPSLPHMREKLSLAGTDSIRKSSSIKWKSKSQTHIPALPWHILCYILLSTVLKEIEKVKSKCHKAPSTCSYSPYRTMKPYFKRQFDRGFLKGLWAKSPIMEVVELQIIPWYSNSIHTPLATANVPMRQVYRIPTSLPIPESLAYLGSQTAVEEGTQFSHKLLAHY